MSRFLQIVQNGLIRVIAFFSVIFRSVFDFLGKSFGGFGKSLGFSDSNSGYYVDADTKKAIQETKTPVATVKTPEGAVNSDRRRPKKSNMDDFMKMAKEIKK
ncbi:threonine dehydratase [Calothrix sp. CCY 0018]|uniref:threonine dehydratase n=1 Tax=Calothrix sp. CCY 0018 TaxID=3103864 RepID=UPI0039C72898